MCKIYDASHIFPGVSPHSTQATEIWQQGMQLGHQFAVVAKDSYDREVLLTRPEQLPFAEFFVFIQSELVKDDLRVVNAYHLSMPPPDYLIR